MKSWQKTILIFCCLLGIGISFIYHLGTNLDTLGEIRAPIHVNVEIDKAYMPSVSIIASFNSGDKLFPLSAEVSDELCTVVLYSKILYTNITDLFIHRLSLHIPKEAAQEALNAIEGVSIFIGNKMFYFSHFDTLNLQGKEQGDFMLYELPGLEYRKSVIGTWLKLPPFVDWYGDFNMAVKAVLAFFILPEKFIVTWGFLVCLLVLCKTNIEKFYLVMRKKEFLSEWLLLGLVVLVGFILRLNGYVRHSSWLDELYSACQASNPNLPFINTFSDPGNPPFYFILLRLWFMLFGWTEQSGRLFSVLTGSAAIVSLYILVKLFANKKAAFLAALYMAVNVYYIDFSQEMRSGTLQVFLVTIVAVRFLIIIQKRELGIANLIWYIIPSVLLVNTHYYGSVVIFANFLFYITDSVRTKTFAWKKTFFFFLGNILIAISLFPYFIQTTLQGALLNTEFNAGIPAPGLQLKSLPLMCITVFAPLLGILYIYLRKTIFKKNRGFAHTCLLDYAIFTTSAVYFIVFGISLYRPILVLRYLVGLTPLLIAFITIIFMNVFTNNSKLIGGLCIGFVFAWIAGGYNTERWWGGSPRMDIYHESLAYISKDAEAHPKNISVEKLKLLWANPLFYGYKQLPLYVPGDTYDVLYFNPLDYFDEQMYSVITELGISTEKVLRIRVNDSKSVFKIYADALP
jgi:uncharacterized membrane protein